MSEPARLPQSEAEIETAIEAIAERLSRGDLSALVEFLELRGAKVASISVSAPL